MSENIGMQIFNNPEFGTVRVIEQNGEPWFVGKDVAEILGHQNPQRAVRDHVDEEDKGVTEMVTPGGKQNIPVINESGLYSLILSSKLPSAKKFKHWITSEVLTDVQRKENESKVSSQLLKSPEILNIGGLDCYEEDGTAYLRLEAVARGLGFTQVARSGNEIVRWDRVKDYLGEILAPTCGCKTEPLPEYIPENIFYRLAMKAKNEVAEKFQAKVADEIIPAIRKHGAYMTDKTLQEALRDPDYLLQIVVHLKEESDKRKSLEAQAAKDAPLVLFANAVAASKTSILVGELAKLLKQNGVDIGQNRLFEWMRNNGYLVKRKGNDYNMPTQKSMEQGLFEIKETVVTHADGHITTNKTPKVTGRGQTVFVNKFLGKV